MAYSTTYNALKTDLVRMVEDASTDYSDNLDAIIALGELKLLRELDLECFQAEISGGNLVIGQREVTRPAAVLKANSLWITVSGSKNPLRFRTYDYCNYYAPSVTTTGQPRYWAYKDENTYYLAPTPSAVLALTIRGIERPAGLSGTTATTWLSTNVGDLLLLACLIESEAYLKSPGQMQTWDTMYGAKLAAAQVEFRGLSRADYILARMASVAERKT